MRYYGIEGMLGILGEDFLNRVLHCVLGTNHILHCLLSYDIL